MLIKSRVGTYRICLQDLLDSCHRKERFPWNTLRGGLLWVCCCRLRLLHLNRLLVVVGGKELEQRNLAATFMSATRQSRSMRENYNTHGVENVGKDMG